MKKLFRALSLCLTLALCVSGSTAALAEAPAATPAPQDERVITDVSPLEDQIRNIVGFTTSTGGPYDFEQADHRSAVQAYGAEPAEGAVALLRVYARAEDRGDASINSSGHSFLSVRNVSDHDIEVGGLRIAPDTEMTFSPRGNRWEHTGIWYNLEGYYKRYLADSYYQNIYAVQTSLDQGQLDVVNRNLAKSDHWSAYFNCAAFTESMWNAVCADTVGDEVVVFTGHIHRGTMGQVTALRKVHAHNGIAQLQQGKIHGKVGLCTGMRLYVDVLCVK